MARPDRMRQNSTASIVMCSPSVAGDELAAGGAGERQGERLAVATGPLGDDVGDDPSVVLGGELDVAAGGSGRCRRGASTGRG